ncbi:T-complex protein 1 subunit beta [Ophidiomyces ophidiicola]|nr:T-complex protein 1 subunit beta [Ophidiomyces ophidiicola]KAI1932991.1 T-complex protein 1 subunit beta [Ophidiomyces ophidiicola]KAI1955776.1 T-complex protein 1 subunit beta [Ophidiomyces ophidiicola]
MSSFWNHAFPSYTPPTGYPTDSSFFTFSAPRPVRMQVPAAKLTLTPVTRNLKDRNLFNLSALSATQVENASFTTKAPISRSSQQCQNSPDIGDSSGKELTLSRRSVKDLTVSESCVQKDVLTVLEARLAKTEQRVQELEERLRQHQQPRFSPIETVERENCIQTDLLNIEDDAELVQLPSNSKNKYHMRALTLTEPTPFVISNAEFVNFESVFKQEAKLPQEKDLKTAEKCKTLVEGIGSPTELIHHRRIHSTSTVESDLLIDMGSSSHRRSPSSEFCLSVDCSSNHPEPADPTEWDGKIHWVTLSAFDNAHELNMFRDQYSFSLPALLEDGLVYTPRKGDLNIYRTVALFNLPDKINMKTFLKGIRGGIVFSAHLHNTLYISGSHTGIVTFLYQNDAIAYTEFALKNGVYFNHKRARVMLYKTPTYPITETMERNIFELGHTRCLSIRGESNTERFSMVSKFIMDHLCMYFDLGDCMLENDTETEIVIRFNSIQAAGAAMSKLKSFPLLDRCELDFDDDPCADPLPNIGAQDVEA